MLQGTFKRTLLCCLLGASLGVQAKIDEVPPTRTSRPVAVPRPSPI